MKKRGGIAWAYGVTTVSSRGIKALSNTLESLSKAGFDRPSLFADSIDLGNASEYEGYFGFEFTTTSPRSPKIGAFGNWLLGLWELYIRNPNANRYAMFQDDLVTYKNLRTYLERCRYPIKGYWNLFTFLADCNEPLIKGQPVSWYKSDQYGRGALALVFDRKTVMDLLSSDSIVQRVIDCHKRHRSIDGAVNDALKRKGYVEYIHNPSLVQHTGTETTIPKKPDALKVRVAESFRGEDFDAMELL